MQIRTYQPGDEQVQAEIYNAATQALPKFKPATAEEIARRYRAGDPDPQARFYAVAGGQVVGYIVFNANGRLSYPWCLPHAQAARQPLLEAALAEMHRRGLPEAWAAYRADWAEPLAFLKEHGFQAVREMVNYIAPLSRLPADPVPADLSLGPLGPAEVAQARELWGSLFATADVSRLKAFYLKNEYFTPASGFIVRDARTGRLLGLALAITDPRYADPTLVDPAMPCFRLGTLGTETERHKRINGLFSCAFADERAGTVLLTEAARRFAAAGLAHAAAQAPSDQPALVAFYDRSFQRQGSFPILARRLSASG
jgi:ribosomal protein S18 acetylase RimI-like enzyme